MTEIHFQKYRRYCLVSSYMHIKDLAPAVPVHLDGAPLQCAPAHCFDKMAQLGVTRVPVAASVEATREALRERGYL